MVSTDSEEIAQLAKTKGASIPFKRSAETADDFATTIDVVLEVLIFHNKTVPHHDKLAVNLVSVLAYFLALKNH